jgi:acetate---CoA ligase (ADP-forming)
MTETTATSLDRVLRPRSVAVVGASRDPAKRGNRAVRALLDSGYQGRVLPIHPAGDTLHGIPVLRGPDDLAEAPDLVLICTPVATVPGVLEEWAEAGTGGAVVLAVGFRESGAEGERMERAVTEVARRTGIRVVGPNTSGLLNVPLGLNLIGLDGVRPGPLALLVQSGNMALSLVTEAGAAGQGFSYVIGVGNEADLTFDEYLDFLARDPGTRGIAVHAEGFRDGRAFLGAVARASAHLPVVVIKGGRTAKGGEAARSHTGAVAGSYEAFRAGLRQAGAIEVTRTDELLPTLVTLIGQPPPRQGDSRSGIAILSDGGGHATLAVDDLLDRGAPLASLTPSTRAALRDLLGPAAAVDNPVDLAGAADRDPLAFARAFDILSGDPGVEAVLVAGLFGGYAIRFDASLLEPESRAAAGLVERSREAGVALVVHSLYAGRTTAPLDLLRDGGVAVVDSLEVASRAVSAVLERRRASVRAEVRTRDWPTLPRPTADAPSMLAAARAEGRTVLLEPEVRALCRPFGVPVVEGELCATPLDAARAARAVGTPVALRVVSPRTPHKTEAGGVVLGVAPDRVEVEAERMLETVGAWIRAEGHPGPELDLRGLMVSPMLPRPTAELLVGVRRDPQFGPVLTVGAGGTGVEWMRDVSLRVLPVTADEIDAMLDELRMAPLLAGYRGAPGADRAALIRAVASVAACALALPDLAEIEVNPLFVGPDGAVAVDLRAFLDPSSLHATTGPPE